MFSVNFSAPINLPNLILKRKKKRALQSGVKAVKKFIGLGEDAIVVKGVDNLLDDPCTLLQSAARRRYYRIYLAWKGNCRP